MAEYEPWMKSLLNRMKELYNKPNAESIAEALPEVGSGGGGEITPSAIVTATGQMSDAQKAQTRTNLGAVSTSTMGSVYTRLEDLEAAATSTESVSGTTPTITPEANTIYQCGELSSLTVSSFPASGKFWIWFTSGATPTTTVGIANFVAKANKKYKITVENGYATYDSWSIGGGA